MKSDKYPLEKYLYKEKLGLFEQSRRNMSLLFASYMKSKTISFIGAGVSKPLGISDYEGLMTELLHHAKTNFGNELPASIPNSSRKWPDLAEMIYEEFVKKDQNGSLEYFTFISRKMNPRYNTTTLTLIKLVLVIDIHLTTNFDVSIQNAYLFLDFLSRHFNYQKLYRDYEVRYLPDFKPYEPSNNKALISYLHYGRGQNNKSYVFKKEDYEIFYPSVIGSSSPSAIEDCLRYYYDIKTIIFVGFSFQDFYVREFFIKLAKDTEISNKQNVAFYSQSGGYYSPRKPVHFWIVDSNVLNNFSEQDLRIFEDSYYIHPIIYEKDEHKFLEHIFEKLARSGP